MITVPQMKKHLLLLNRLMRTELKKDIIPVPSKLSEEEVNKYFERLFVKKENYYVPIKSKVELKIDEELFKSLLVKKVAMKKTKKEAMKEEKPMEEEKQMKEEKPKKEPMKEEKPMKENEDEDEEDIEFIQNPDKLTKSLLDASMTFVNRALKKFNDEYVVKFINLRKEDKLNDEAYYELTRGYLNLSPLAKYYALQKYKSLEGLVKPYIQKVKQMINEKKKETDKNIKEMKKVKELRKKEEEKKMKKDFKEEYKMEKAKLKQEAKELKME
jgi:hypothetical protein